MASSKHRAAAFVLLLASGLASAEPSQFGPYLEASAGKTHFDLEKAGLDYWSEVPAEASSLDRRGTGYALAVGFRYSRYLAVEVAYMDLGRTTYLVEDNGAAARLDLGSKGPALSLIGSWPISEVFSLEGRAGLYFSDVDIGTTILVGAIAGLGILEGESGGWNPGWLLGAGAVASFGDRWSIRAGYDYFDRKAAGLRHPVQDTELESRAGRWSLNLRYSFF
jgi:opacity protein-like surface antigen